ncbi:hypothetical protein [Trinickia soli]|uniref:DUF3144 domain-containing protein n=1 Tax=Trinickia soli TaxID=380675 RepID=A0A2N7VFZ2_9BURK|nr:hypothetical protein [Trinickia soli]KAA0073808.1 hypothetical protein CIW54_27320 [Paraburkholderia sp. T12-10]PMS16069.1 hypothetical protein C0Z19_26590 [Trinickia soli]CAB3729113.1 hypothetical protein LMG24076_05306 [Trinickia soli]
MQRELRQALDTAYSRLRDEQEEPTAFAGNYALGLGIVVGGQACGGMTEQEAADERAHLAMLAALYEVQARIRIESNIR